MPGVASLKAQQYYAHPQNLFWKILGSTFGFDPTAAYEARTQYLTEAGVAVWDVLASCMREGSLDADIDKASAVPNDFATFFAGHPLIERVCFNGNAAETIFMRRVRPVLPAGLDLEYVRLPSTSPANASIPFIDKARVWTAALRLEQLPEPLGCRSPL